MQQLRQELSEIERTKAAIATELQSQSSLALNTLVSVDSIKFLEAEKLRAEAKLTEQRQQLEGQLMQQCAFLLPDSGRQLAKRLSKGSACWHSRGTALRMAVMLHWCALLCKLLCGRAGRQAKTMFATWVTYVLPILCVHVPSMLADKHCSCVKLVAGSK